MKNTGTARSYGLYRHLRASKEIIENLLNYLHTNKNFITLLVDYSMEQVACHL